MKLNPTNYRRGSTLVEVLAVITVILALVFVLLPILASPRRKSSRFNCVYRLKQVQLAFKTWSSDNMDKYPMQVSTSEGGSKEFVASGYAFHYFQVMSNEGISTDLLLCPLDMTRDVATNFQNDFTDSKISYFVGVDASRSNPQSFLTGDSHLAIGDMPVKPGLLLLSTDTSVGWTSARHQTQGNVGLADGSVQKATSSQLQKLLIESGLTTNRLSIP